MIRSRPALVAATIGGLLLAVLWTPRVRAQDSNTPTGDPVRGERIAMTCSRCHGDRGISAAAWIPNLAGLNQEAIYKQLADYRSGQRWPEWYMAGVAQALSLQDSADVSAYYARQTGAARQTARTAVPPAAASCGICHNAGKGVAPRIEGQQPQYLEIQLSLFAQGVRSNDQAQVMRQIAAKLTVDQIRQISESLGQQAY